MKREAKFTMLFRHWLRAFPRESAAFELKQTTTDSIPFSDVQEHQIDALLAVKDDVFTYKISDESRGIKPFDMFTLNKAQAYVVIKYPKFFVLIDIDDFVTEKQNSIRRSLTSSRAKEISTQVVEL